MCCSQFNCCTTILNCGVNQTSLILNGNAFIRPCTVLLTIKLSSIRTYVCLYSYLFNARTRATPVPVHVLVYTPVAIAVSYKTADAKRTVFSDLATFVHTNVLLMC